VVVCQSGVCLRRTTSPLQTAAPMLLTLANLNP
jgi:hypothetical protein